MRYCAGGRGAPGATSASAAGSGTVASAMTLSRWKTVTLRWRRLTRSGVSGAEGAAPACGAAGEHGGATLGAFSGNERSSFHTGYRSPPA